MLIPFEQHPRVRMAHNLSRQEIGWGCSGMGLLLVGLEEGQFNGSHLHIGIVIAAMEWMTDLEHGLS